jgi:ComF family protein
MAIVKKVLDYVWDIFYPKSCIVCGTFGQWVCGEDERLLVAHPLFECPKCRREQTGVEVCADCKRGALVTKVWVVTQYHNPIIESLIRLLKYQYLTDLTVEIKKLLVSYKAQVRDWESSAPFIPVPLYWRKECERGFNQAELIARAANEVFGNPVRVDLLERTQNHSAQARLSAQERHRNVTGGFRVKNTFNIPRRVILVDDVYTTGATMDACAQALKSAGVEQIWGLVIARG